MTVLNITIVSGFLGAGKTTLINYLIKKVFSGKKITVLLNDFGETYIDKEMIKEKRVKVKEIRTGCICCSQGGDPVTVLEEVIAADSPERIVLELSATGKLSDLTDAIKNMTAESNIMIDHVITVVDGEKCGRYIRNFSGFYKNQIEHAEMIVVTRMQNMAEEHQKKTEALIRQYNNKALLITENQKIQQGGNMNNLKAKAYALRRDVVNMIMEGKAGHIGGDMSVMETLVTLYFHEMNISPENQDNPGRDKFVMSKGHCVEALYAVLAAKGFFPIEQVIREYSKFGSSFIGHPNNKLPGIEMNSGSLGHGLPVAVGMALAEKMNESTARVYVVMGDGELAEGSVWEGAMSATQYRLDNLCAVVDRNQLQISGTTEEVMHQNSVQEQFESFGWHVVSVDGNDVDALVGAFEEARTVKEKPTLVVANTVKGCGSPVMENKAGWHHHVPTPEEYEQIMQDLKEREEACKYE